MAISNVKNNYNKAKQAFYNAMPNFVAGEKATKFYKYVGKEISSAETRLITGVSALLSQPFIDLYNKKVDEETRKVAVCRTVAKIIAGTLTGVLVRKGAIQLIKNCSKLPQPGQPKWKSLFTPKDVTKVDTDNFKQYQNAIGTFVSLGVMLFTNFFIDAPLTAYLTNKFSANVEAKKTGGNL